MPASLLDIHRSREIIAESNPIDVITKVAYNKSEALLGNFFAQHEELDINAIEASIVNLIGALITSQSTLASAMNVMHRDFYTHTHSINVAIYALYFGIYKKFPFDRLFLLTKAGMLHDIGKLKVDEELIHKGDRLTAYELEQVKIHVAEGVGLAIRAGITSRSVLDGIREHHENFDGSGYIGTKKGHKISEFGRILALCDLFDSLVCNHTYKKALTIHDALAFMIDEMGYKFDPKLLGEFVQMVAHQNQINIENLNLKVHHEL